MCWLLFGVRSTLMASKTPLSFCQNAGSRLHLNTHTPSTQWGQSGLTMPLSRHSVRTYYLEMRSHAICQWTFSQSSQLTEPLWTDPGIKSGIGVCELISTPHPPKKKKAQAGIQDWMVEHSLKVLAKEKATTITTTTLKKLKIRDFACKYSVEFILNLKTKFYKWQ